MWATVQNYIKFMNMHIARLYMCIFFANKHFIFSPHSLKYVENTKVIQVMNV